MVTLWAKLLDLDDVGHDEDFFELGGDSLLAAELQLQVDDAFGVEIPSTVLYRQPTISAVAAAIEEARKTPPASVNLSDPALYADGRQYATWAWLREHDPVWWQPLPNRGEDAGFWAVTRYADVQRVIRDHESFTSERGTLVNLLGKGDPAAGAQLAATDPPLHDQLRAPLQKALGARPIEAYGDEIAAGIRRLLASGIDGEPFDLAAATARLPMVAMTPMLALPPADTADLIRLVSMCNAEEDPEYQIGGATEATLRHGHRELFAYLTDLVRVRRRRPGDDLVSYLLTAEVNGEAPPVGSIVSNCYSMLLGAAGTVPHVPTAAVAELSRTGGYRDWATRPELLDSGVEEALRWASPASNFMRYTRRPVTLVDRELPEGVAVVAYLGSANRDPEAFPEPETFDIRRQQNRHLAFGVGRHYCVGSHLARYTLRRFFRELFETFDDLAVTGEAVRVHSTFLSGFKKLMVTGSPARRRS
ncbi:cytochrome P450 [Micromonospora sp. STR1_7]|uniref:Cytochrome P450 n=1 Tax=Micromonospora parastrephiae TaxID=2806101 RepID=A0ABS1XN68_9ACTN|nr:cytochrome P450 [Micromonospora parastrephiae]MBM0230717.1 cytochrome P450 [Micromonospora parastrephiae]